MSNRVAASAVVVKVFLLAYLGQHGNDPILFGDGFPLLAAVRWRVLPSLHHAPYIDFVFQHELHISPCPEVAAFKFSVTLRVVLAETGVFLGG